METKFREWIVRWKKDLFPVCTGGLSQWNQFIEEDSNKYYFPDFRLFSKNTLKSFCWIDVKTTQRVDNNEFNLNWHKHEAYTKVANISGEPSYIVVYEKDNLEDFYFGRVDTVQSSKIPLKFGKSKFLDVIQELQEKHERRARYRGHPLRILD